MYKKTNFTDMYKTTFYCFNMNINVNMTAIITEILLSCSYKVLTYFIFPPSNAPKSAKSHNRG